MTHVVAEPGDRRSLCGVKEPLSRVWAPYVNMHVRGHGMIVCPDCAALLPQGGAMTDEEWAAFCEERRRAWFGR